MGNLPSHPGRKSLGLVSHVLVHKKLLLTRAPGVVIIGLYIGLLPENQGYQSYLFPNRTFLFLRIFLPLSYPLTNLNSCHTKLLQIRFNSSLLCTVHFQDEPSADNVLFNVNNIISRTCYNPTMLIMKSSTLQIAKYILSN